MVIPLLFWVFALSFRYGASANAEFFITVRFLCIFDDSWGVFLLIGAVMDEEGENYGFGGDYGLEVWRVRHSEGPLHPL